MAGEPEAVRTKVRPGSRGSAARWIAGAAIWFLAVSPQVLHVMGHGDAGSVGAVWIATIGAVLVGLCVTDGLRVLDRLVAAGVVIVLGLVATMPYVGRAPWILAVVTVAVGLVAWRGPGVLAASWSSGDDRAGIDPAAPRSPSAILVIGLSWPATVVVGPGLWSFVGSGVAVLLALGSDREVPASRRADVVVGGIAGRLLGFLAPPTRRAARWCVDPGTRVARWSGLVGAAVSVPVFWRLIVDAESLVRGTNDFHQHVERAFALSWSPLFVSVPHPGWHLSFRLIEPVVGDRWAVVLIGAAATGALVAILVTIGRSAWDDLPALPPRLAAFYGLSYVLLANPAALLPQSGALFGRPAVAGLRARGSSFFPLHLWGSPTITMSLPVVMAMFATLLFAVRGDVARARAHRVALLVLTVCATAILPAATLALVPAVPLYLIVTRTWDPARLRILVPWFLVPGALVAVGQTLFLASEVSVYENTTWRWNPLWMVPYFGMDRPAFWLLFAVVPAGIWLCGRRYVLDPAIGLSACAFGVALVPALLLQQTNPEKLLDGDLAMPLLFAAILLVMASVRLLLIGLASAWVARSEHRIAPAAVFAGTLIAVMACAGVLELLAAAAIIPEA